MAEVKYLRPPVPIYRDRPFCCADVQDQGGSESWRKRRTQKAKAEGRRPWQCGRRATVSIDGKPYCALHAGPILIAEQVKESDR